MKIINPEPEFVDRKLGKKKRIKLTVCQFLTVDRNSVIGRGHWCLKREMKNMSKRQKIIECHA